MPTTNAKSPGTVASDATKSGTAWTGPSNAVSSNDLYATCGLTGDGNSQYLKCTNFGFTADDIPAGSKIKGVFACVEIKASLSVPGVMFVIDARAVKGGVVSTTNLAGSEVIDETGDEIKEYGGQSELWGETWTDSDITASDFGVAFAIEGIGDPVGQTCSIDHVTLRVNYEGGTLMATQKLDGDLLVTGTGTFQTGLNVPAGSVDNAAIKTNADIARSKLGQTVLASYPILLTDFRIHDAMQTNLPGAAAGNDLGLVGGVFATNSPTLQTADQKANGAGNTDYARCYLVLPPEYDDGETVNIRVRAGMKTTVSDNIATIDVECFESDQNEGIGSDLCTTAATTINAIGTADKDFVITSSTLAAGDILDLRIALAITDGATATAVIGVIGSVELLCDIRG